MEALKRWLGTKTSNYTLKIQNEAQLESILAQITLKIPREVQSPYIPAEIWKLIIVNCDYITLTKLASVCTWLFLDLRNSLLMSDAAAGTYEALFHFQYDSGINFGAKIVIGKRDKVLHGFGIGNSTASFPGIDPTYIDIYIRSFRRIIACRVGKHVCITTVHSESGEYISNTTLVQHFINNKPLLIGHFLGVSIYNRAEKSYFYSRGNIVARHVDERHHHITIEDEPNFDKLPYLDDIKLVTVLPKIDKMRVGDKWTFAMRFSGKESESLEFTLVVFSVIDSEFEACSPSDTNEEKRVFAVASLIAKDAIGISIVLKYRDPKPIWKNISTFSAVCFFDKKFQTCSGKFSGTQNEERPTNLEFYKGNLVSGSIFGKKS